MARAFSEFKKQERKERSRSLQSPAGPHLTGTTDPGHPEAPYWPLVRHATSGRGQTDLLPCATCPTWDGDLWTPQATQRLTLLLWPLTRRVLLPSVQLTYHSVPAVVPTTPMSILLSKLALTTAPSRVSSRSMNTELDLRAQREGAGDGSQLSWPGDGRQPSCSGQLCSLTGGGSSMEPRAVACGAPGHGQTGPG